MTDAAEATDAKVVADLVPMTDVVEIEETDSNQIDQEEVKISHKVVEDLFHKKKVAIQKTQLQEERGHQKIEEVAEAFREIEGKVEASRVTEDVVAVVLVIKDAVVAEAFLAIENTPTEKVTSNQADLKDQKTINISL
jgi:hypothetical protein